MKATIKFKGVIWGDQFQFYAENKPVYPGVDGAVKYELSIIHTEEEFTEMEKQGVTFEDHLPQTFLMYQPFKLGGTCQVEERNVWGWDGNKTAPTWLVGCFSIGMVPLGLTLSLES